jgi:hypothetical protein
MVGIGSQSVLGQLREAISRPHQLAAPKRKQIRSRRITWTWRSFVQMGQQVTRFELIEFRAVSNCAVSA